MYSPYIWRADAIQALGYSDFRVPNTLIRCSGLTRLNTFTSAEKLGTFAYMPGKMPPRALCLTVAVDSFHVDAMSSLK